MTHDTPDNGYDHAAWNLPQRQKFEILGAILLALFLFALDLVYLFDVVDHLDLGRRHRAHEVAPRAAETLGGGLHFQGFLAAGASELRGLLHARPGPTPVNRRYSWDRLLN